MVIDRRVAHRREPGRRESGSDRDRWTTSPRTRPGFSYSIRDIFEVNPSMADRNGPVARSTAAAIRRVIGRDPEFICSPGTYDQKHIDRIGKLKECIAYGPGLLDLAHQAGRVRRRSTTW